MIKWNDACTQVGYDMSTKNRPERIQFFYAYRDGISKMFDARHEALAFSSNIEAAFTEDSKKAYADYWTNQQIKENEARKVWYDALREEYSHLSDDVFNACYSKAYEDGHAHGSDEIANEMISCVEFAEQIIKAITK